MPSRRACLALSTSLLGLGILACTNDNDPLGIHMDTGEEESSGTTSGMDNDDASMSDDESDSGVENCGMTDPECTTNAACGTTEICVDCMCVDASDCGENVTNGNCLEDSDCGPNETCEDCSCSHPCAGNKDIDCGNDSDCDSGSCDPKACTCDAPPEPCGATDQCDADEDCSGSETCNLETCVCEPGACACQFGGPLCAANQYCDGCDCQDVPGLADPADDCDADGTPIECNDSTDLLGTEVSCDAGAITVTAYFDQPVQPTPDNPQRRIVEFLDPLGYLTLRLFASAPGDGVGPYDCSVITPGVMMNDLGPDDVCEINEDGSFQFVLSPDSAMLATGTIDALFARSENSDPYHYDDGDPIPNPCM